jgi:Rrf2 family protein
LLSTTAEYALRITILLAEADGESLTTTAIAESTRVPADYAVKVLQLLARSGLVHGRRGRRGGFTLDCDAGTTTLLDVVDAIDPLERITVCPLGRVTHRKQLCPLHSRLDEVIGLLQDSLGGMTLRSVVEGRRGPALCRTEGTRITVSARGPKKKKKKKKKKRV